MCLYQQRGYPYNDAELIVVTEVKVVCIKERDDVLTEEQREDWPIAKRKISSVHDVIAFNDKVQSRRRGRRENYHLQRSDIYYSDELKFW